MAFKVDDRVKYAPSQEGLGGSVNDQPGTVTKVHDVSWVNVQWDALPNDTPHPVLAMLLVIASED